MDVCLREAPRSNRGESQHCFILVLFRFSTKPFLVWFFRVDGSVREVLGSRDFVGDLDMMDVRNCVCGEWLLITCVVFWGGDFLRMICYIA